MDTGCFRELERYYHDVFPTFWSLFQAEVSAGNIVSVREVWRELQACPETNVIEWAKGNLDMFKAPTPAETAFVGEIFAVPHFRQLISAKARMTGQPVADPFLIAAAKICNGTVVTQERLKPNAAKIPNVCDHFGIPCLTFEGFLKTEGWTF
ncbi:PIN domain-containing protein [Mesorhizobium sp.]|uniref:PIN domain-containing protein n=1 Tax=Mesorhizobium sp. TaxID=1871066 RepID=UPI0025DF83DB|nr:PIN domain-containing protein [Mesorhizobium sp.]